MNKNKIFALMIFAAVMLSACQSKPKIVFNTESSSDIIKENASSTESNTASSNPITQDKVKKVANKPIIKLGNNKGLIESNEKDFAERKGKTAIAMFFTSSKCNNCISLEKQLGKELFLLPDEVTLLKFDFDKETGLEKEYSVKIPGLWIILDKNGNEIARNAGIDIDSLIIDLTKAV